MDITNVVSLCRKLDIAKVNYKDNPEIRELLEQANNKIMYLLSLFPKKLTHGESRFPLSSGQVIMSRDAYKLFQEKIHLPDHAFKCVLTFEHKAVLKYSVDGYVRTETGITVDSEADYVRKKE